MPKPKKSRRPAKGKANRPKIGRPESVANPAGVGPRPSPRKRGIPAAESVPKVYKKRVIPELATTGTISREEAREAIRNYLNATKRTNDPPPASASS